MSKLADLETAVLAKIAYLKNIYNEEDDLNQTDMNICSTELDMANETWNGNLPPRPTS